MRTLLLTLTTCLLVLPAYAKYSGGSGTAQDPSQIATAADLILLGNSPADYDKHFLLTADIDWDPKLPGRKVFGRAVIAPDTDQVKPGFQGTTFTGVFDGNRHAISHLTIKGGSYLGLFGVLVDTAEARDLGVVDVNVAGSGSFVGGLVGGNGGIVTQCHSTGGVSGRDGVGVKGGSGGTGGWVGTDAASGRISALLCTRPGPFARILFHGILLLLSLQGFAAALRDIFLLTNFPC